jgi:hypothetical protein
MAIPINPEVVEVVSFTAAFFCAVGAGLKKAGLLTIGRGSERRSCPGEVKKICGDHMVMKQDIEAIKINSTARLEKLNSIADKQDGMDAKLDGVAEHLSAISGFLQARNGFHK